MNDSAVVLIVAVSARALAQSARRAGLTPVAIDAFGDEDARALCADLTVAPNAIQGFAGVNIDEIVPPVVRAFRPRGIVYGSGFDDCPEQLRRLARYAPLLGASPASVAAAKDPVGFARLCAAAGLRHPDISTVCPPRPENWLLKRAGGCGGLHIRDGRATAGPGDYWQKRKTGRAISLLFTRDACALVPLAWSEQWTAPVDAVQYRYGGAAGPLTIGDNARILTGLSNLTEIIRLRGLASADFLDDGESFWLLEINPRPGATLDLFDNDADPLILRHLTSLAEGAAAAPTSKNPRASAVLYAKRNIIAPTACWPEWAADLAPAETSIPVNAPLCTIRAEGDTITDAKALLADRVRRLYEFVERVAA